MACRVNTIPLLHWKQIKTQRHVYQLNNNNQFLPDDWDESKSSTERQRCCDASSQSHNQSGVNRRSKKAQSLNFGLFKVAESVDDRNGKDETQSVNVDNYVFVNQVNQGQGYQRFLGNEVKDEPAYGKWNC